MNTKDIKSTILDSIRQNTEYEIEDNAVDGIAKWIGSGGNTITQASLAGILIQAIDKVWNNIRQEK